MPKISILEKLIRHPEKFSFVKALDIILALDKKYTIRDINVKSKMNFQSKFHEVHSVNCIKSNSPELTVNIGGIAGIEGTLPDPYVEEYSLYNRYSKNEVSEFYDILNNKMLSLLYFFYKKNVIYCSSNPIEKSQIGDILNKLSGIVSDNSQVPAQFKISAQNLFWRNCRSAEALRIIISSFFEVEVKIEQFNGSFIKVSNSEELSRIGIKYGSYNVLGNAILGNKIWDSTNGIIIHLISLEFPKYISFLPKISKKDQKLSKIEKLKEIVKLYVPYGIHVKIVFHLNPGNVKGTILNQVNRLNKDAFMAGGQHNLNEIHFVEDIMA
ncbi:MAG: type VI secretion system baseplate subunit TssG [Holosporales bacterium]|jgi:predicted component of type VI protein secretion system|nr:type VI secretion system baseplate subunit TssG [Holosporales bacterium]